MDHVLVLEDGCFFLGRSFGARRAIGGEVVFNTSPTGYQEILTDPSYAGQVVVLTTAHVGNYGVNAEDVESSHARAAGLVVRDHHPVPSNWRSDRPLASYLEQAGIPALESVDTRALVLHLRDHGVKRGIIAPLPALDHRLPVAGSIAGSPAAVDSDAVVDEPALLPLLEAARGVPDISGRDLVRGITCERGWSLGPDDARYRVVAMDFGIKRNIVRQLARAGCRVQVVPATTAASEIMASEPDGVLLSNGPGDPEPVTYAAQTVRELLGRVPLFGICLGHQILGIACGGRTFKLKFGHRGGNHPVRDLQSGRVEITAQNHGFAVDPSSLDGRELMVTHTNLNDDTIEGIRHRRLPAFSVQFHPEASPGPHDSHHLFTRFVSLMERQRRRGQRS